jgi:hypothetical protein
MWLSLWLECQIQIQIHFCKENMQSFDGGKKLRFSLGNSQQFEIHLFGKYQK